MDPRDILGEDLEHGGVDGVEGTNPEGTTASGASPPVATRAECEAAARHMEELAVDLAAQQEPDPAKKAELQSGKQQYLASEPSRQQVEKLVADCLAEGMTQHTARCIARARSEADLDRCLGG